jgi:uncharacterized protein (DUF4415 family)
MSTPKPHEIHPFDDPWWETDEGEAEIQRQIAEDPDDEELSEEALAEGGKSFAEAHPDLDASLKRSRGRPRLEKPRQHVSLRLDPDVIEKFKATGPGWRSRINDILRRAKV